MLTLMARWCVACGQENASSLGDHMNAAGSSSQERGMVLPEIIERGCGTQMNR